MANEVKILVNANTKGADSKLTSITQKLAGVGRAAGIAGGAILAIGAGSVTAFAKMGDEVHKMALRTGFSTEMLSGLRVAADLSGASLQGMEKGIARMQRTILDAGRGLSTATDSLDRMGVNLDDLKGKTQEEIFHTMLMGLASIENHGDKAGTAMEVFGRAGTGMLPMLTAGSEGLKELIGRAAELGVEFDQVSADKAARFTDSLTLLKGSMQGVMLEIGEQLAPHLATLAEKVSVVVANVSAWMKENPKLTQVLVIVAGAVGAVLAVLAPLLILLPGIVAIAPAVGAAWAVMVGPVGWAIGLIVALGVAWATNLGGIRDKTKEIFEKLGELFRSKLGWILPGGVFVKALFYVKDNWDAIWDGIVKGFVSSVDVIIGLVNKIIRALNSIKFEIPEIIGPFGNVLFKGFKFGGLNIPEIELTGEMLKNKIGDVVEVAMELPDKIKSSVGSMFEMGEETDKTKNAVIDLSNEIDKMNQKIAKSATAATGGVGGGVSSGMGGGMGGIPISSIGDVDPWDTRTYAQKIAGVELKGSQQYRRDRAAGMTSDEAAVKYAGREYTDPETGEFYGFGGEAPYRGHSRTIFSPAGAVTQAQMTPEAYLAFQIHLDGIEISKNQGDIENAQAGMEDE